MGSASGDEKGEAPKTGSKSVKKTIGKDKSEKHKAENESKSKNNRK